MLHISLARSGFLHFAPPFNEAGIANVLVRIVYSLKEPLYIWSVQRSWFIGRLGIDRSHYSLPWFTECKHYD